MWCYDSNRQSSIVELSSCPPWSLLSSLCRKKRTQASEGGAARKDPTSLHVETQHFFHFPFFQSQHTTELIVDPRLDVSQIAPRRFLVFGFQVLGRVVLC